MSKDEVERMVKDAESNKAADERKKQEIEARNMADSLCYTAEKSLRDAGDKVPAELKESIDGKVKEIRDVLQTASKEELQQKTQELSVELQKIGQHMYGSQEPGAGPEASGADGSGSGDGNSDGGDGDFEEPVEGEVVEE